MPSVSSLLKQAESARKKKIELEDQLAAYDWSISAKTQDDFLAYTEYLSDRLNSASDPSKALGYQKTITSVRRSFVSHEIQRQTIDVLEGRTNNTNKYNQMVGLYQAAVELGDLDLAQSLRLQLDNLDLRIQSEQQRANSLSSSMASASALSIEDTIDYIKFDSAEDGAFNYIDENGNERVLPTLGALKQIYENGGEESINEVAQLVADATGEGAGNYWDVAQSVIEQIVVMYQDAANIVGADTSKGRTYLKNADKIQQGVTTFQVAPGMDGLSYQDIKDAVDASRAGQQLFIPVQRNGKNEFKKTNVTDYVWGRDENGDYKVIEVRQEFGDVFTENGNQKIRFTNADGKEELIDAGKAKERLSQMGFNVKGDSGSLTLGLTDNINNTKLIQDLQAQGISPGTSFDVVIGEGGNLRFVTPDERIFDIKLGEGTAALDELTTDEVSIFGRKNLGQYGRATSEGISLIKQITRQDVKARQSDLLQRSFTNLQDTSGLLNAANVTSERLRQAEKERLEAARLIQPSGQVKLGASGTQGLNYTPVPSNASLRVEPISQPTSPLRVSRTTLPTNNLRVTSSAPSTNNLRVTDRPSQPRLSVSSGPTYTNKLQVR